MTMQWNWNGWNVASTAEGLLRFVAVPPGATLNAEQAAALADVLVALATMAEVDGAGAIASQSAPAIVGQLAAMSPAPAAAEVAKPAAKAHAPKADGPAATAKADAAPKEAKKPAAAKATAAPAKAAATTTKKGAAAQLDLDDIGRSRQGTTERVDGKPVKRGPKAAAARFAALAQARRAAAKPAKAEAAKDEAAASAAESAATPAPAVVAQPADTGTASKPATSGPATAAAPRVVAASTLKPTPAPRVAEVVEDHADLPPAVQEVLRGLDARARLLRPVIAWMARTGRPVSMDEIVAATKANHWSTSDAPQPALAAALQRAAQHIMRDHTGAFSLRALRPEAKVVKRRPSEGGGATA